MKKKIALLLTAGMLLSVAACGKTTGSVDDEQGVQSQQPASSEQDPGVADQGSVDSGADDSQDGDSDVSTGDTIGTTLDAAFTQITSDNPVISPQELADALLSNEVIEFMGTTMEVEPGYLNGFDQEITGFESAVMFSPTIGTIPFVGYIFALEEEANPEAFIAMLKENANPRWNVCTEADEIITSYMAETVMFLMCPSSMEE